MKTLRFISFFYSFFLIGCNEKIKLKSISTTFVGFGIIYEDALVYKFNLDNTYHRSGTGHLDVGETDGTYSIFTDTIKLTPFPKEKQIDSFYNGIKENFLLIGDSCMVNLESQRYYCQSIETVIKMAKINQSK